MRQERSVAVTVFVAVDGGEEGDGRGGGMVKRIS